MATEGFQSRTGGVGWTRREAVVALGVLALVGCDQKGPDREALRRVVASDERVVGVLQRVDDLAMRGEPEKAAELLSREARPASRQSVEQASGLEARSEWGKARVGELKALVRDRATSLDRYEAALKSGLLERVVEALEEQKKLDKRGATLAAAVTEP